MKISDGTSIFVFRDVNLLKIKWGTKNTNAEEAPPGCFCECRNLSESTTFQKSHEPEIGCFDPPKTRDP